MRSRRAWAVIADVVVLAPLGVALMSGVSSGDPALVNVSAGLGLVATSLMVVVTVLVSRVRGVSRAVGLELSQGLHRRLGVAVVGLALAHAVLAVVAGPAGWGLLDMGNGIRAAQVGVVALVALLLIGLVLPRGGTRRFVLRARLHALLAGTALVLVGLHVVLLRRLVADPVVAVVLGAVAVLALVVGLQRWALRPLLDRGAHVVAGVRRENETTTTLILAPTHLRRRLHFEPGQFVWLRLHRGVAFADEHPFTLAAGTRAGRVELTVRETGAFTTTLCRLERGRRVWLDGPHGAFTPGVAPADGLVLVAGGIGLTPMMSILRALAVAGDPRPHRLLLAERPGEALFPDELDVLARRLHLCVTRTDGRPIGVDLLTEVLPTRARDRHGYFVCGPSSLIEASLDALAGCGVPDDRIVTEQFH